MSGASALGFQLPQEVRNEDSEDQSVIKKRNASLGWQRPHCFSGLGREICFVFTVVTSTLTAEYYIGGFNIIQPHVAQHFNGPDTAWPTAATSLTTAALLLPFARLCDIYGSRRLFLFGQIWLGSWAAVAGFSQNSAMLIACRAMQGIGSAATLPAGMAMLGCTYRPGQRKNVVFTIYGAFASIGFFSGLSVGAVAVEYLAWQWYFWIGAIFGLCVAAAAFASLPKSTVVQGKTKSMDWWGTLTISPGLVLVMFAFLEGKHARNGWKEPYVYISFTIGLIFLAAASYTQVRKSAAPLLTPKILRTKYVVRLLLGSFCLYGTFGIFLYYGSLFFTTVLHMNPLLTAAWFAPLAAGGILLAVGGGFFLHAVPNRSLLIISSLGLTASVAFLAFVSSNMGIKALDNSHSYWAYIFPAMVGATVGVDLVFNVGSIFITTVTWEEDHSAASAMITSVLYLGIAFWLGIVDLVLSIIDQAGMAGISSEHLPFEVGAYTGIALSGLGLCLFMTIPIGKAEPVVAFDDEPRLT